MNPYRLRVKIGTAEFEAEGPEELVKEQFEQFKELLKEKAAGSISSDITSSTQPAEAQEMTELGLAPAQLKRLFTLDQRTGLLSLSYPPHGEDRLQAALLLILGGYRGLLDKEEMPVTVLKDSLEQSGFNVDRVDRIAGPLIREGMILKGGKAKGGKYRLTNLGRSKAENLASQLIQQVK